MRHCIVVYVLFGVSAARAQPPSEPAPEQREVVWVWPRVRPWEYVAGPVLAGGSIAIRFAGPEPERNWQGGILFDDAIRDTIRVRGEARGAVRLVSDGDFYGGMAFRVVDSAILPGVQHHAWDVALQMAFIDLGAFGVVGAALWGSQLVIGRERPYVEVCREDAAFAAREDECESDGDWNRSFFAGHPATGVTAAALTCLHHSQLPLYGRVGDPLVCGVAIAAASANGVARVMTEHHNPSDVLVGVGVGIMAGYVIPRSLHYGWGTAPPRPGSSGGTTAGVLLLPDVSDRRVGLSLLGRM